MINSDQALKGKELCRSFFHDEGRPILERFFPNLTYTAGLLGYGSDVLGFDDDVSRDHMWGPRFYLFVGDDDVAQIPVIEYAFKMYLPYTYKGFSVNFSEPDENDGGVRHMQMTDQGAVYPLIFVNTSDGYLQEYIGVTRFDNLRNCDWLKFSEHKLLALTAAELYRDDLGLGKIIEQAAFYPPEVLRYLVASQWSLIGEEQAFVYRTAEAGDDLGSQLVCARIAERLMRLCFLYNKRYAPYSKWFGTAFQRLPNIRSIRHAIKAAVGANDIAEREERLVEAQVLVAKLHNQSELTTPLEVKITDYFGRGGKVIWANKIADAVSATIKDEELKSLPLIGSLSQVANFTAIYDKPEVKLEF